MREDMNLVLEWTREIHDDLYHFYPHYIPTKVVEGLVLDAYRKKIKEHDFSHTKILDVCAIRGEMAHIPEIPSIMWTWKHSIYKVTTVCDGHVHTIYTDPTEYQYSDYAPLFMDYYIGVIPPKYFLPNKKNVGKIKIPIIQQAIQFGQYKVWGTVSDVIGKAKWHY